MERVLLEQRAVFYCATTSGSVLPSTTPVSLRALQEQVTPADLTAKYHIMHASLKSVEDVVWDMSDRLPNIPINRTGIEISI